MYGTLFLLISNKSYLLPLIAAVAFRKQILRLWENVADLFFLAWMAVRNLIFFTCGEFCDRSADRRELGRFGIERICFGTYSSLGLLYFDRIQPYADFPYEICSFGGQFFGDNLFAGKFFRGRKSFPRRNFFQKTPFCDVAISPFLIQA